MHAALPLVRASRKEVKKAELVRDSLVPQAHLDTHGQEKICIINVDSFGLTWRSRCWLITGMSIDLVP